MHLKILIAISVFVLLAAIFFMIIGTKNYLSEADDSNLKYGIGFSVLFLEMCVAICYLITEEMHFSTIIWILCMLMLIFQSASSGKAYKDVKNAIDCLNRFPEYKDVSDKLFTGFINFGNKTPTRTYGKERKIYNEGLKEFTALQLPEGEMEAIAVQKQFRTARVFIMCLYGALIAFLLQIPVATILMIVSK